MDEEAVEPFVDLEDSRARINHIQCKGATLSPEDIEEAAIYEDKDGDWGVGMVLSDPGAHNQEGSGGGHSEPPVIAFEGGSSITPREASAGAQEEASPHYQNMNDGEIITTRQSEEGRETHRPGMATATGQSEVSGETPRPETVADSRSEMEEDWEESEVPSRDETLGPSELDLPQTGQVTTRKHKLSKDREPTKFIPRLT